MLLNTGTLVAADRCPRHRLGVGAMLVGIAFRMLGIGLGFAIILGLSALLGSLTPFLIQTPEKIFTSQGPPVSVRNLRDARRNRSGLTGRIDARPGQPEEEQ
jgi:hypothetical protein